MAQPFLDGGCLVLIVDRLVSDFSTYFRLVNFDLSVLSIFFSILVDSVVLMNPFSGTAGSNKYY
jgi:hypothetical protein